MDNSKNRGVPAPLRLAFFILFCPGILGIGQTASAQLRFDAPIRDATFEKYDGLSLIGRIHITRTFIDHEKWGFFKVGVVPIGVVDGVNVQIRSAESLTNTLEVISSRDLSPGKLKHVEFRDLEVSLLGEKEPRLRADNARLGHGNILELSGISVKKDGEAMNIAKATLQVSGPNCGCLRWNDAGGQEQLFVFQPLKN